MPADGAGRYELWYGVGEVPRAGRFLDRLCEAMVEMKGSGEIGRSEEALSDIPVKVLSRFDALQEGYRKARPGLHFSGRWCEDFRISVAEVRKLIAEVSDYRRAGG